MVDTIGNGTVNASASAVRTTTVEPDKAAQERRDNLAALTEQRTAAADVSVQSFFPASAAQPTAQSGAEADGSGASSAKDPLTRLADTITKGVRDLGLNAADIVNTLAVGTLKSGQELVGAIESGNQDAAARLIASTNAKPTREYGALIDLRV